jgi:hypothetical protein
MSELAVEVLTQAGIQHSFNTLVMRIACQTEEILVNVNDPDCAYKILWLRAKKY